MKKLYQLNNYFSFRMFAVGILLLLSSNQLFADGSKNLYPSGAKGFRAYLRSSEVVRDQSYMFPTKGTHYVYAKAGERIALASSAQLAGNRSAIQLYSPTGTQVVNNTSSEGLIANRGEEICGPKLTVNAPNGGYAPVYYDVPTTGTGIYRVEFISRGDDDEPSPAYEADKDFVQKDNRGIMAWDVSVINSSKTNFVQGRVYTNVFNLSIGTGNDGGNGNEEINGNVNGFYGLLYVLTKDGFTYKVNNNGNNGYYFTFFANNNGFLDPTGNPAIPPTEPGYECSNNGVGGMCNNITKVVIDYSPLAICTESLTGSPFVKATASTPTSISTIQPGTTNGFTFDIFSLDNSFNININGITIANAEIQFQSGGTSGRNIRFVDGTQYEVNTPTIFNMTGTVTNPLVRVVISASGEVTMYGSKVSGGPLFPLELYGTAAFNTVIWNQTSSNTVVINQIATGPTRINGTAYGTNIIPCPCYKPAVTTGLGLDTKMGITALNRAGADNGNWPMVRKGAHLALEAKTKGFVPTRIANPATAILNPVDGMMVYDTTKECLSIYVEDAATPANSAWKCIGNQTCPE